MKCRNIRKLLPAESGGELGRRTKRRVNRHLQSCGMCRAEFEALVQSMAWTSRALRNLDPGVSEEHLRRRVFSSISGEEVRRDVPVGEIERTPGILVRKLLPGLALTAALVALLLVSESTRDRLQNWIGYHKTGRSLPVIENVGKAGVTVLTFKTDDPKVTIVWLFEDEPESQGKRE